jgi:hypothetical protein
MSKADRQFYEARTFIAGGKETNKKATSKSQRQGWTVGLLQKLVA